MMSVLAIVLVLRMWMRHSAGGHEAGTFTRTGGEPRISRGMT
jgi:hypothetical protein